MTKWKGPAAWGGKEAKAGDRLPYLRHVDPVTLMLRDGSLMRSIAVAGLSYETEDSEQLNHLANVRDVAIRSILDARFVLYHHVVRRRVAVSLQSEFESPLAAEIDRCWTEKLNGRKLFMNEQTLTLVRRPARGKAGWAEKLAKKLRGGGSIEPDLNEMRELDAATAALQASLTQYGVRLLGMRDATNGQSSELLELLSSLYNGESRPVIMPGEEVDLGHHLPYSRVSFGLDAIETRSGNGRNFAAMLGLKAYPDHSRPGLIDGLLQMPHELILTESFSPVDRQIAKERIDLALRRLKSADEHGGTERAEMLSARDALGSGQTGFGDHHLSLLVRAPDLEMLDNAMASASAAMADMGAIAVREDVNLEPAFWGQMPGNEGYVVRRALISTANASGFFSLHGFPLGKPTGNRWGDAVSVIETTASTPYFFNFHSSDGGGDLGHFTVIGPSGSGKTVVLNFLTAQAQKFSPRTFLFDKDRGAEIFIRGLGGHYDRLVPGERSGFNPLKLNDTPINRGFVRDLIGVLVAAETPEERATVAEAVDASFDNDSRLRQLRHFHELLAGGKRPEPGDLASRLEPWINDGEFAWLFDNVRDELTLEQSIMGFDMTALLDQPKLRTPAMMYLFHRIDERLDGAPTMIVIDEGWKALDDPVFAARLRDWLKTLRKRNAIVGFATQSASDALSSRIASAIVEQTATMIFTPNAKAREEDYCKGFGLSAQELDLIRALPAQSRCFLVRHVNHSVIARLDLSGMPEVLMVLSGHEANVRRLDGIRASVGDNPAHWYPLLTGQPWPGGSADEGWLEAAE